MAFSEAKLSFKSRSEMIQASEGLILFRIEDLGERGEIAGVEYHVSRPDSHERWIFNNQFDATFCFYDALRTGRGRTPSQARRKTDRPGSKSACEG